MLSVAVSARAYVAFRSPAEASKHRIQVFLDILKSVIPMEKAKSFFGRLSKGSPSDFRGSKKGSPSSPPLQAPDVPKAVMSKATKVPATPLVFPPVTTAVPVQTSASEPSKSAEAKVPPIGANLSIPALPPVSAPQAGKRPTHVSEAGSNFLEG